MNSINKLSLLTQIKEMLNMNDKIVEFETSHDISLVSKDNTGYETQMEMLKFYKDILEKNKGIKLLQSSPIKPIVELITPKLDESFYHEVRSDLNIMNSVKENYLDNISLMKRSMNDSHITIENKQILSESILNIEKKVKTSSLSSINNIFKEDLKLLIEKKEIKNCPDLIQVIGISLINTQTIDFINKRLTTVKDTIIAAALPINELIEKEYKNLNNNSEKSLQQQITENLTQNTEVAALNFKTDRISQLRHQSESLDNSTDNHPKLR